KGGKIPLPLVIIQLTKNEQNKEIFKLSRFMQCIIKIERLKKSDRPTICYRCSLFHHSANTCHNPPRCGKCSGPHESSDCSKKFWGSEAKCPNCSGNHVANYRECPKYPVPAKSRNNKLMQEIVKNRPPPQSHQSVKEVKNITPEKSYAQAANPVKQVKNLIQEKSKPDPMEVILKLAQEIRVLNRQVSSLSEDVSYLKNKYGKHN
ncbi:hypothetical protein JGG94_23400, partial [Salmonella enterica subsp. enterica serovar Infantis]|nr:hypothetical protein [Salmonella enterica subsp. enterica serovar Infantis]